MNNAKHTQNLNNLSLFLLTHQHYIARNNNGIDNNKPLDPLTVGRFSSSCVHIIPPKFAGPD